MRPRGRSPWPLSLLCSSPPSRSLVCPFSSTNSHRTLSLPSQPSLSLLVASFRLDPLASLFSSPSCMPLSHAPSLCPCRRCRHRHPFRICMPALLSTAAIAVCSVHSRLLSHCFSIVSPSRRALAAHAHADVRRLELDCSTSSLSSGLRSQLQNLS